MKSAFYVLTPFVSLALASASCGGVEGDAVPSTEGAVAALEVPPLQVNGCTTYLDLTEAEATREIAFDFSVGRAANRCMKVRAGQTVTWTGNLGTHPLAASGGDTPSPIETVSSGSSATVTFTTPGTFGYVCTRHRSMNGAIYVVP